MDNVRNALKDLIMRLTDAERGYREISNAVSDVKLKRWMSKYAQERSNMRESLERFLKRFGGKPNVETSFLGDMHRMFIDLKINYFTNDYDSIYKEIERGSNILIKDYQKCLDELKLPLDLHQELKTQMLSIQSEIAILEKMKSEFEEEIVS